MKLSKFIVSALFSFSYADSVPWERLEIDKALLLILDLQVGLYTLARDFDSTLYHQNMLAHAALGQIFDIPVVLTTSSQQGPNGPLPKEILEMYPDAPLIQRQGEVSAWDNAEFRAAVKATNRTQVIVGGIVTDVCTTFLTLALREEGYSVWANVEASGTTTPLIRDISNDRMRQAGVNIVSLFYIVCDLMRSWTNTPGSLTILPWLDIYYPVYGFLARGHAAALENGTVVPGEQVLIESLNGTVILT